MVNKLNLNKKRIIDNRGRHILIFVIILLLIFILNSVLVINIKNLSFDDPFGITVGYYFLKNRDTSLFLLHPPLSYMIGAFPLTLLDIELPYSYEECKDKGRYQCAQDFLFNSNNNVDNISLFSRFPFVIISAILGLLVFQFSKNLYGLKSGILSLILYVFSTAILAYNTRIFTDVVVAFFIFSTFYILWLLEVKGYTLKRLILLGISLGLALASKFTAILIIPIVIFILIKNTFKNGRIKKRNIKKLVIQTLIVLLTGFLILSSTYFFSFGTIKDSIPKRNTDILENKIQETFGKDNTLYTVSHYITHDLIMPIPEYLAGFFGQSLIGSTKAKTSYLNGDIYQGGKWYYFIEVLLIKFPIPLLLFFIFALISYCLKIPQRFQSEYIILIPIIVYFLFFILNDFNLGLRHILPIVPFIYIFSTRIIYIKFKKNKIKKIFTFFMIISILWYILSSLLILPHYVSYFNELVGGPKNGHNYLLGSNLDQGQDLKLLKKYIKKHNIDQIKLSYHGMFDPKYYNISYIALPMEYYIPWNPDYVPPRGFGEVQLDFTENCSINKGIIAISASNLYNVHLINKSCFDWLKPYSPIDRIGYTIFIYNIT